MTVTLYSFLMAMLWFSAFVLLGTLVQRGTGVVLCCRPLPLLGLAVLTVVRLVLPMELPVTHVVRLWVLYPAFRDFLRAPVVDGGTIPYSALLLGVWGMGCLLLGLRLGWHICRDRRTVAALPTVFAPAAQACLTELLGRRAVSRPVALRVSPALSAPQLAGLLHPVILLPPKVADLPRAELEHILLHELTHLEKGDLWVKLLVRLLSCALWWNPCVYLLEKDLDSVLEYKCDLAVTQALPQEERRHYLKTMLTVLRQQGQEELPCPKPALAASFLGIPEGEILKRRFRLVLNQSQQPKSGPQALFLVTALILFVCSYSVVFQPASVPREAEQYLSISPENAYILAHQDGTYLLICNGAYLMTLTSERLDAPPYCYLEIVYEKRN